MPTLYLSPSTQQFNPTVIGNSEEYYMNLIADAMEPYLTASGIQFSRNTPEMTAASSIRASNAGNYDLHLAIHSNAAPEYLSGQLQGADAYYYPGSSNSRRFADYIVENLRAIYLDPNNVEALPTTSIGEVARTNAPAVLVEVAYHDNYEDAAWIRDNIDAIAAALARAVTQYFNVPFVTPQVTQAGTVTLSSGTLNIRSAPSLDAPIIASAQNGDSITVLSRYLDWYAVNYNGIDGYAFADYITIP
ncbi:MAG: peptidoglycan hydrolase [Ruminococcaceae bacterium]|nr:peptidoglycan hydrolase [Oscillospiraceae bacterium]